MRCFSELFYVWIMSLNEITIWCAERLPEVKKRTCSKLITVLMFIEGLLLKKGELKNFAKFTGKHLWFCQNFKNTFFTEYLLTSACVALKSIWIGNGFGKVVELREFFLNSKLKNIAKHKLESYFYILCRFHMYHILFVYYFFNENLAFIRVSCDLNDQRNTLD